MVRIVFPKFLIILISGIVFSSVSLADRNLASVNGKGIGSSELLSSLGGMNQGQRRLYLQDIRRRKESLQNLINQELMAQEASRLKLDQGEDFKSAYEQFRKQWLVSRLIDKKLAYKLTPTAVKMHYQNNLRRYTTDRVHALHILANSEREAKELKEKAKRPGADFEAIAEKYSHDPAAKSNRGDLGYFFRTAYSEAFSKPVFSAKSGSVIGPIPTAYGYHIVKVVDRQPGKTLEFHEVEPQAEIDLQQTVFEEYLASLRGKANVKIDDVALRSAKW